jgi:RNA polymerase sigma-70 factor (ECF subfamily)
MPRACRDRTDADVRLDEERYRALFEAQRDAVFRFLHRLCRNSADADDLLQETFLAVWRKRDDFREEGALEGWLHKTAFRTYLNAWRKRRRREALEPAPAQGHAPAPAQRVGDKEERDYVLSKVRAAVDALPDGVREAFLLFRYEGWTCPQIAALMDENVKTVETRVRRATLLLAERLHGLRERLPVTP